MGYALTSTCMPGQPFSSVLSRSTRTRRTSASTISSCARNALQTLCSHAAPDTLDFLLIDLARRLKLVPNPLGDQTVSMSGTRGTASPYSTLLGGTRPLWGRGTPEPRSGLMKEGKERGNQLVVHVAREHFMAILRERKQVREWQD